MLPSSNDKLKKNDVSNFGRVNVSSKDLMRKVVPINTVGGVFVDVLNIFFSIRIMICLSIFGTQAFGMYEHFEYYLVTLFLKIQ